MTSYPVFDYEGGAKGMGVFHEKGVVAYAKTHNYIEVCFLFIKDQGLGYWVAPGFKRPRFELVLFLDSGLCFVRPSSFAHGPY